MRRKALSITLVAVLACSTTVAANTITPISQQRTVDAHASATDAQTSDVDGESHGAPGFALFQEGASAQVSLSGALGAGSSYQTSEILPTSIQATGGHAANGEGWEYEGYGDGDGRSFFDVTFQLEYASDYTLTGTIEAFDSGQTDLQFDGPGGSLHSFYAGGDIVNFSETGTLPAGTYSLRIDSSGSAYGDYWFYDYASGYYDVSLTFFNSVHAPAIASGTALRVAPNPFRGSTRITHDGTDRTDVYDAGGRLVRSLPGSAASTSVVWDGRDDSGRSVPAGVYFLRIDSKDATQETARVIRLR